MKDELLIEGERKIVERKARFCTHCRSEVTASLLVCPECAERPDGKPDADAANSVGALARILRPTVSKWLDRGNRSVAGNMRDDYRRRWRRAKQLGFTSVHDRFMNDPKENFKFRCNMLANGWTEETVREIDAIAEAPGQPVPKAGQGRTWHQRTQYEGWYDRVDGHGAETETPIDQRNVPEYVHVRNAQRRAETAIAKGQLPEPGKSRSGYQEAKGKGPGKGKGHKRSWDCWRSVVGDDGQHLDRGLCEGSRSYGRFLVVAVPGAAHFPRRCDLRRHGRLLDWLHQALQSDLHSEAAAAAATAADDHRAQCSEESDAAVESA